jgi:hypothetical protein
MLFLIPKYFNNEGFGPARLLYSSPNKAAIRGQEQILIDAMGGAKSTGGTAGNKINSISQNNPYRDYYLSEAQKTFG